MYKLYTLRGHGHDRHPTLEARARDALQRGLQKISRSIKMHTCTAASEDDPYDFVCERAHARPGKSVYINALADKMPFCDRKSDMTRLDQLDHADTCFVYCAQDTCSAARSFMEAEREQLKKKCGETVYLHNGALAMERGSLRDGTKCHEAIAAHNAKSTKDECLTCGVESLPIAVKVDGKPLADARYIETDDEIPNWYIRMGTYSPLPKHFTCDRRYDLARRDRVAPVVPRGSSTIQFDISQTGLPKDAWIGYWASKATDTILPAADAYDKFANSGMVQCDGHVCKIPLDMPGKYTAEGQVFEPHLHFTHWNGAGWDMRAKTISFPNTRPS